MAAAQEPLMSGAIGGNPGRLDMRNLPRLHDLNNDNNNNSGGGGGGGGGDDDIDMEDDDDDDDEPPPRAAEALRLSKLVYHPLRPGPDNPTDADGVALGVVLDRDARRWRERRMRLARYVQFVVDGPAIDDADENVPAPLAKLLDLDFGREEVLVAAPVVKGGRAGVGMGSFVAARPAPCGVDLRKRREWVGRGDGDDADADGQGPQIPLNPVQPGPSLSGQKSPARPPPHQQQEQFQPQPQKQQPLSEKARGKLPAVHNQHGQGKDDPFARPSGVRRGERPPRPDSRVSRPDSRWSRQGLDKRQSARWQAALRRYQAAGGPSTAAATRPYGGRGSGPAFSSASRDGYLFESRVADEEDSEEEEWFRNRRRGGRVAR